MAGRRALSPWRLPCPSWRARRWWSSPTAPRSPNTTFSSARSWSASSTHKTPTRQQIINDLIDDRLKIAKAKVYGLEVGDAEVEQRLRKHGDSASTSRRQQFAQVLERAGISPNTVKARIRAELTWQQLVRGKFSSSLQVGETDIANALQGPQLKTKLHAVGYIYTLYPVMVVVARGSSEAVMAAKRSEAENLRGRFASCNEGLALARALRDVAVREPITRSSADSDAATARTARQHPGRPSDRAGSDGAGAADVRGLRQEGEQQPSPRSSAKCASSFLQSALNPSPRNFSTKSASRR